MRPARIDDAAAIARLGQQTFVETFVEGFEIPYPPEDLAAFLATYSTDAIAARLTGGSEAWWVAEGARGLEGFTCAGPCGLPHPDARASHAELKNLYIARDAQGKGHGRALFRAALEWMGAFGDGPQWIGVWSGNLKAQRFYAHYGFRKVGEYEFPVGRWRDLEHILRKG